jgi:hypothetical protein
MGWLPSFLKTNTNTNMRTLLTKLNQLSTQRGYHGNINIREVNTCLSALNYQTRVNRLTPSQFSNLVDRLFISIGKVMLTHDLDGHRELNQLMAKITDALGHWCYENENKLGNPKPWALDSVEMFNASFISFFDTREGIYPNKQIAACLYNSFQDHYAKAQTKTYAGIFGTLAGMGFLTWAGWGIICAGGPAAIAMLGVVLLGGIIVSDIMERFSVIEVGGSPSPPVELVPPVGSYSNHMSPVAPTLRAHRQQAARQQPPSSYYWASMTARTLGKDPPVPSRNNFNRNLG